MNKYKEITELASRRSIFYPSSEIYSSAPAGFWSFGPYGEAIRRKIIDFWRKEFVQKENMLELYGSQIMPKEVFEASGHLKSFNDPLVQCKKCNTFHRADELISSVIKKHIPESTSIGKLNQLIKKHNIKCPKCQSQLYDVKLFNMMIRTDIGPIGKHIAFLRPEACQVQFLDFNRMMKTMRIKLPKGLAQVGRAFRNEISPRQSLFREVEFSQMEAEIFFDPKKINDIENFDQVKDYKVRVLRLSKNKIEEITASDLVKKKVVGGRLIAYYLARVQQLYEKYGISREDLRFREVDRDERAFYARETWDFEVDTGLGWMELIANNDRTDYDIKGHMKASKKDLTVEDNRRKFIPYIWEVSAGVDRTFYAILDNAFKKEKIKGEERIILSLNPRLAPFDAAVLPLVSKDNLPEKAKEVVNMLGDNGFDIFYDESGSIGRRYRRLDEVGVAAGITIDYESLEKNDVTIRDRDSMKQIRVKIINLLTVLRRFLNGEKIEKLGKIIN